MRIQELIAFVTRSLNYIAVVTRVNVARNLHKQTREIRFGDWLAYCYTELSHLRSTKYRISIARVSSFIGHHRFVRVTLVSFRYYE